MAYGIGILLGAFVLLCLVAYQTAFFFFIPDYVKMIFTAITMLFSLGYIIGGSVLAKLLFKWDVEQYPYRTVCVGGMMLAILVAIPMLGYVAFFGFVAVGLGSFVQFGVKS